VILNLGLAKYCKASSNIFLPLYFYPYIVNKIIFRLIEGDFGQENAECYLRSYEKWSKVTKRNLQSWLEVKYFAMVPQLSHCYCTFCFSLSWKTKNSHTLCVPLSLPKSTVGSFSLVTFIEICVEFFCFYLSFFKFNTILIIVLTIILLSIYYIVKNTKNKLLDIIIKNIIEKNHFLSSILLKITTFINFLFFIK